MDVDGGRRREGERAELMTKLEGWGRHIEEFFVIFLQLFCKFELFPNTKKQNTWLL